MLGRVKVPVEPGATPLQARTAARRVAPGSTGNVRRDHAIDSGSCHRARRRQGYPRSRSAAMPPLTPPARGADEHWSMA